MGLRQTNIHLADICLDSALRIDEKFHSLLTSKGWNLFDINDRKLTSLKSILSEDYNIFGYQEDGEYKGIPTGREYLDEDGEIICWQNVTAEQHPDRLKYRASSDNILISSLRLAKSPALQFPDKNLSNYVFSNGFYIFKVGAGWNIKFILSILRLKILKSIIDDHIYRGIGISAYKQEDLLKIKIPLIKRAHQDKIVAQIEPLEQKIKQLKSQIKGPQEVINKVFTKVFDIDLEHVFEEEQKKQFFVSSSFAFRNHNLRSSVRWHKIVPIQKAMYKNTRGIMKLGDYILSTKNGWSPSCKESDTLNMVFGVNCISKRGIVSYEDIKLSDESRTNIESYFAKNGDLFVSRGNTVDLVALAAVVEAIPDDKDFIFPDLFIRLDVDENHLDKKYLAYLFNSIIGRFYFKYSAKGKNQTMVKISSDELNNFFLPVPALGAQQEIVDEIQIELDAQEIIKVEIENLRIKIDEIIMNAIKSS
jgi:type I restriction enzyme S subunit